MPECLHLRQGLDQPLEGGTDLRSAGATAHREKMRRAAFFEDVWRRRNNEPCRPRAVTAGDRTGLERVAVVGCDPTGGTIQDRAWSAEGAEQAGKLSIRQPEFCGWDHATW